jgi:hypothetical protein
MPFVKLVKMDILLQLVVIVRVVGWLVINAMDKIYVLAVKEVII